MKKITLISLVTGAVLSIGSAQAREIGVAEAMQTAREFTARELPGLRMAKSPLKLISQANTETGVAYYVFAPETGSGFTIVSGNDVVQPILGYSSGTFDPDNIPAGLAYMLDCYRKEIEYAVANGFMPAETPKTATKTDIEPLCKTIWDQDAPFSNLCPNRYYTGCVATAMAQAVYVFKYPEKSKGSATWNGTTVSFNRTYNWKDMLLSYTGGYTTAQGTAVAELMVDLGKSVDMDYGYSGSGAETYLVPGALYNNFSYDKGIYYSQADNWPVSDWNEMMYYQLQHGMPIIYGGFGNNYYGGHQFIADGYQYKNNNDYFHINWGWSGVSDGYFLLTALNPSTQGAGGNTSNFSTGCDAVYFVQPPVEGSEQQYQISCRGNFGINTTNTTGTTFRVTNGSLWSYGTRYFTGFNNIGSFDFKATLGVRLINREDPSKTYTIPSTVGLQNFPRWSTSTNITSFVAKVDTVENGSYYVYPMSRADGKTEWNRIMCPRTKQGYILLTIDNGTVTSSNPSALDYIPINTMYLQYTDSVTKGHTLQLKPTIIPSDPTNPKLIYSSTNESIATVSESGVVYGVKGGNCEIKVTTTDGSLITRTLKLKVNDNSSVKQPEAINPDVPTDVYTMTGILVARGITINEIKNLAPGIYIAGGKKYIVR